MAQQVFDSVEMTVAEATLLDWHFGYQIGSKAILDRWYCCVTYAQVITDECKDAERECKTRSEDARFGVECGDA
jgi:hypothetical protein